MRKYGKSMFEILSEMNEATFTHDFFDVGSTPMSKIQADARKYRVKIKVKKGGGSMGADEAIITGNERDIIQYAKKILGATNRVRNLKDLGKELNAEQKDEETDLEEFKTMTVTLNDPKKMKDLIQAIRIFGPKLGLKTDVMNPKKLKVYGNNTDLNKYAKDIKNFYGGQIKAESIENEIDEKFSSIEPKVIDRIEKMMNGSRQEKDQIQNMLNYLMPREVVDMVRYKLKIKEPMGKIKIR